MRLDDVVLVNESPNPSVPGDVSVFRDLKRACLYLEHWWVEQNRGIALMASGEQVVLGVERGRVVARSRNTRADGAELVMRWLLASATAVSEAHRTPGQRFESVEELVAYVGFTE